MTSSGEIQIRQVQIKDREEGGEDPRAGFEATSRGACQRKKEALPPIGILETEETCRAVVIRKFMARSESRGEEGVEVW